MLTPQQLKERQNGLGGSDLAALLGISPYKSPYELYIEKTIEDPQPLQKKASHLTLGILMEDVIEKLYEEEQGVKTYKCERVTHPTYPIFFASPDRLVETTDGTKKGVEFKNVGDLKKLKLWGCKGTKKIPDFYYTQIAQGMFVLDYDQWDIAPLLHGNELRVYTFHRDKEFDEIILEEGYKFWNNHVIPRIEPPLEPTSKRAKEFLKRLYPTVEEKSVIELPDDLLPWTKIRQESKALAKQYQTSADIAEAHILHHMQNHEKGVLSDGSCFVRKSVRKREYTVPEHVELRLEYKENKGD